MVIFDRKQSLSVLHVRQSILLISVILAFLTGCSLLPPVQEMSNARQSLNAAKSAGAEVHDSERFSKARALLDKASLKIDMGEYGEARALALEARNIAIKSRQVSLGK